MTFVSAMPVGILPEAQKTVVTLQCTEGALEASLYEDGSLLLWQSSRSITLEGPAVALLAQSHREGGLAGDGVRLVDDTRRSWELTLYDDGELLFWSAGRTFVLDRPSATKLLTLLSARPSTASTHAQSRPVPRMVAGKGGILRTAITGLGAAQRAQSAQTPRKVAQHIRREAQGWGCCVSPALRYIYGTREQARAARLGHRIGMCGRVA